MLASLLFHRMLVSKVAPPAGWVKLVEALREIMQLGLKSKYSKKAHLNEYCLLIRQKQVFAPQLKIINPRCICIFLCIHNKIFCLNIERRSRNYVGKVPKMTKHLGLKKLWCFLQFSVETSFSRAIKSRNICSKRITFFPPLPNFSCNNYII